MMILKSLNATCIKTPGFKKYMYISYHKGAPVTSQLTQGVLCSSRRHIKYNFSIGANSERESFVLGHWENLSILGILLL